MKHAFLGYDLARKNIKLLPLLRTAKCQRLGSDQLTSIFNLDFAWLSGLSFTSTESFRADCRTPNGEEKMYDILSKVKDQSVDVPGMDDLTLLLQNNAGWRQDIGSVDPRFVEACGQYRGEFVVIKLFVSRNSLEIVKIGGEVLLSNAAHGVCL